VQRNVKSEILLNLDTQQSLCNLQVATARYGQKLGQALYGAEYD
jgi:hypothetical protein